MRCPFCAHDDSQVKDSRPSEDNSAIRRRRHCPECGGRFTTFERVQLRELVVVKKNGRRESFDRDKLERSINHALRKRPVERERVERTVTGIVRRLESMGENEIPANVTVDISDLALNAAVRVRDLPENPKWKPVSEPETMIVHVVMPKVEEVAATAAEPAAATAAAEPEVIKKGKTDKEEEAPAKEKK